MAKIGSCKLEKGYCYLIDNYQSKLKVNTKTDCREYRINYKKKKQGRIDYGRTVLRSDDIEIIDQMVHSVWDQIKPGSI
jgi:hypothetical protein